MGVNMGAREVVGYGMNGEITYVDNTMSPFPAIRFQEDKGEIVALRAKEKGDWKKLTIEEKKALYRASFCQTIVEIDAPTGEWKNVLAGILSAISVAMCMMAEEHQKAQIERMIALRVNPIEGLGSTYDY